VCNETITSADFKKAPSASCFQKVCRLIQFEFANVVKSRALSLPGIGDKQVHIVRYVVVVFTR